MPKALTVQAAIALVLALPGIGQPRPEIPNEVAKPAPGATLVEAYNSSLSFTTLERANLMLLLARAARTVDRKKAKAWWSCSIWPSTGIIRVGSHGQRHGRTHS